MAKRNIVKLSESKLQEMIVDAVKTSLTEGIFDTINNKIDDFVQGYPTKEGNPQNVKDVFEGDGWEVLVSPEDNMFGEFEVAKTTGAFGVSSAMDVEEMIEEINIFLNGRGFAKFIGKKNPRVYRFMVNNNTVKENNMKITESQLRRLVESCVREALEGELEEGFGWDAYKNQIKGHEDTNFPSLGGVKEFIDGEPDEENFRKSKERYDLAKDGNLYDPEEYEKLGFKGIADRAAEDAVLAEPGMKGKLKRGAIAAGYSAGVAKNKIKKGFSNLGKKKNNDNGSFTI